MTIVPIERDGPVRTVRLNRPEKRNALNREMLGALLDAFRSEPDKAERLTVLRAEGPVFCAGMDLRERAGTLDTESPIEAVLDAVQHYPLPVVAVVHGDAIAGGNELALHCDLVVAAESARFGMSLAQIGLVPTWFLAKKIVETGGPVAAREMLLLGDPLPAARMQERIQHDPQGCARRRARSGSPGSGRPPCGQCAAGDEGDEGRHAAANGLPRCHAA